MTEHCDQCVKNNAGLGQVCGCHLKEDVLGVETDLGMFSIDDGWEGQDDIVGVINDWIDWTILELRRCFCVVSIHLMRKFKSLSDSCFNEFTKVAM